MKAGGIIMHPKDFSLFFILFILIASTNTFAGKNRRKNDSILLRNVKIFNGISNVLSPPMNVLINKNKIEKISQDKSVPVGSEVIDANGMTLMPGLIDAHTHITSESISINDSLNKGPSYLYSVAVRSAELMLMRGFTTIRDVGGASIGMRQAIDEGIIAGPRIYSSGASISQTGGHSDFGGYNDSPKQIGGKLPYTEASGMMAVADGADQVLMRVREQLRQGATQIKLMAGGGVASNYDPLDVTQYTQAEFKAAVDAASNWGTYVTVHAYTPKAIQVAIKSGVKCIEHGQLMDEPTAKLLAQKGIWLTLQPFLDDEDAIPFPEGSANRKKQLAMVSGTDNAYKLAKKYKIKTAFGTDTLFDAKLATKQGKQLAKLKRWYKSDEILKMATSTNARLLAMSGPRNPYNGNFGIIEEGALADILIVNGNPLEDINLISNPEKNFFLIMKDGKIYKNLFPKNASYNLKQAQEDKD
jgi:imidazolonepropionase-like amidohydrolase